MSIRVTTVQVWLSSFLPLEEKIANYPPQVDATKADSSNAAGKNIFITIGIKNTAILKEL